MVKSSFERTKTVYALLGTSDSKWMTPAKVKALVSPVSVPVGGIIMWSGTQNNIPAGWHLCDGTNGTPDLRNRFVMGAGSSYSPGNTGGASSVSLSVSNMPSHSHVINPSGYYDDSGGGSKADYGQTAIGYKSTATSMSRAVTGTTGSGSYFSILNPYYALCFIMFIGSQNT